MIATSHIRPLLRPLFDRYGIKSINDAGAGDLNWIRHVDLTGIVYRPLDLVPRHESVKEADINMIPLSLVVVPMSLLKNWVDEAEKNFEPQMLKMVVCHEDYKPDWRSSITAEEMASANMVLINYEGLRGARRLLVQEPASDMISNPRTMKICSLTTISKWIRRGARWQRRRRIHSRPGKPLLDRPAAPDRPLSSAPPPWPPLDSTAPARGR